MWIIFLFLFGTTHAHLCCSTCACNQRCEAPQIEATISLQGLSLVCHGDSECACVVDELDTCTYGETWQNYTLIEWHDARWNHCIQIEQLHHPFRATALVRWWRNKCMGHTILDIEVDVVPTSRDLFVDFNVISFYEHDTIYNVYHIQTQSGSDDERPMAGDSTMFFEATEPANSTGVHVEITNCTVQMLAGSDVDAPVLKEYNVFDVGGLQSVGHGQRFEYDAFWDGADSINCGTTDCTNSPFQRLVCSYALFNGTDQSVLLHNTVNRTYMMANPDETGILVDHTV